MHDLIRHRGQTYRPIGRHGEALTDINRAIELWPEAGWAVAERDEAYRLLDRYDDALIDSTRVTRTEPGRSMRAHQPGWTYRLMAGDNGALADFNLAIALWPDADETVTEQRKTVKNTVPNWRQNLKQNGRRSKH